MHDSKHVHKGTKNNIKVSQTKVHLQSAQIFSHSNKARVDSMSETT